MKQPSLADKVVRVSAYLTDEAFGYEHWRAAEFSAPRRDKPALLLLYETDDERNAAEHALEAAQAVAPPKLNALATEVHTSNRKWWYGPDGKRLNRNKGELLMLVVTEVAEAMEGERKNLMDDKLPHRRMAEVEVVDAIVRLLDYAAGFGYDLDGAFREKMAYNSTREDHKREAASIAAGTAHV